MDQTEKCKKVRFNSRKFAELHIIAKEKRSKNATESEPYFCDLCNSWHITSLKISRSEVVDLLKQITELKKELNHHKQLLGNSKQRLIKEQQKSSSVIEAQKIEITRLLNILNSYQPITNANSSSEGL